MSSHRLGRRALRACTAFVVATVSASVSLSAQDGASGIVVDQTGRELPRAFVRTVDPSGAESASTFSDEHGRFHFASAPRGCQLRVALAGFSTATSACEPDVRVVLVVAPVRETVIVSATRTEAPSEQVGASVTTFTAQDLAERRAPLLPDLLRSSPGAMVIRTGQPGAVSSLFVRGGESNYNKVLLDGIPLNEPGGSFNFSNVTTENLARVEIVRGAQSALFGSDAMSSVVQLFTKAADPSAPRPVVSGAIEGGTYDTVHGNGGVTGAAGRVDYSLAASQYSTDNREPNSRFTNTTLSGNVGVALPGNARLRVIGRGELEHAGTPGQTAFHRPDLDAFFERHDGAWGVSFDQQTTPTFRQRATVSAAISHYQSTDLVVDPPYISRFENRVASFPSSDFLFDSRTKLARYHASYQADVHLINDGSHGDQLLTVLADWDGERASLIDALANTTTPASRNNEGVSIQHQAVWTRLVATGGLRYEHNESFGDAVVPRGSLAVVLNQGNSIVGETRVRAAAGLGIKEPTLLQSFSPSPFFRGNPNLKPERSRSVEAGVEQRFAGDRARLQATWFDNEYKNLITTVTTNPTTFEAAYFNIGLTRAKGVEIATDAAPVRALHVRGGYTFLDSVVVDSTSPFSPVLQAGQPLFRRPRHSGFAGVGWNRGPIAADLSGLFIGRYVDSDFASLQPPMLENPGYTIWDARVSYVITSQLSALFAMDNIANNNYMEPLGYRALGRAVRVGIRVQF
jgi:outer membrane cobalamin receptor